MRPPAGLPAPALAALAGAGVFALLLATLLLAGADGPSAPDRAVAAWLADLRGPGTRAAATAVTLLGDGVVVAAVTAIVAAGLAVGGRWRAALYLAATLAAAALSEDLVKLLVARSRPSAGLYGGWDAYAFPSGHATKSAALGGALLIMIAPTLAGTRARRLAVLCMMVPVLAIGCSRLLLDVHWVSDVAAGFALGAAWAGALGLLYRRRPGRVVAARPLIALALGALALAGGLHMALELPAALERYRAAAGRGAPLRRLPRPRGRRRGPGTVG